MAVDLFWDSPEQTTLVCQIAPGWTWDELELALHTAAQLSEGGDVGVIIHIVARTGFPDGILAAGSLRWGRQMLKLVETIPAPCVIVGDNLMAQLAAEWTRLRQPRSLIGCALTLAEAQAMLAAQTLQPAP